MLNARHRRPYGYRYFTHQKTAVILKAASIANSITGQPCQPVEPVGEKSSTKVVPATETSAIATAAPVTNFGVSGVSGKGITPGGGAVVWGSGLGCFKQAAH